MRIRSCGKLLRTHFNSYLTNGRELTDIVEGFEVSRVAKKVSESWNLLVMFEKLVIQLQRAQILYGYNH